MRVVIPPTEDAAVALMNINFNTYNAPGYLYIIGNITTESVSLKRPTVIDPDVNNPDHWAPVTEGNTTWSLNSINSTKLISGGITLQIRKESSPGNAFGIGYM